LYRFNELFHVLLVYFSHKRRNINRNMNGCSRWPWDVGLTVTDSNEVGFFDTGNRPEGEAVLGAILPLSKVGVVVLGFNVVGEIVVGTPVKAGDIVGESLGDIVLGVNVVGEIVVGTPVKVGDIVGE